MTELIRTILLRVTLAGAASAAAIRIAGDGALREVVKMAAGLLMLLALLQPLAGLHLLSRAWPEGTALPDTQAIHDENVRTTMNTLAASIAEAVERRAQSEGYHCTVEVAMGNDADGILQVDRVTVRYDRSDAARLDELRALLTEECGVPEERQELIER